MDITINPSSLPFFNHTLWIRKEISKAIQGMHVKAGKFAVG
jgi:hypothetical protein